MDILVGEGISKWSLKHTKKTPNKKTEGIQTQKKIFIVEKLRIAANGISGITRSEGILCKKLLNCIVKVKINVSCMEQYFLLTGFPE